MSKQWWESITLPQKEDYLLLPILKISVLKKHV